MHLSDKEYQELLKRNPELRGPALGQIRPASITVYPARDEGLLLAPGAAPLEEEEQIAIFQWAAMMESSHPELRMLRSDPIGGFRHITTARKFRAMGARSGFPDIFLYAPGRGPDGKIYHGLAIELKRADRSNGPTPEQDQWLADLRAFGYMALVCYGADEAIRTIVTYLGIEE